jgi:hypothetical protein
MSGLEATGFVPKTSDEIFADVEAAERALIADDLDVSAESVVGQINQAILPGVAEAWEVLALVYACRNPRDATLAALEDVCAFTGTTRRAPTKGLVVLTATLNAGATVPAGAVAHVAGQSTNRWVTTEEATNSGGSPADFEIEAEAETAGVFVAPADTITVIATPVSGWTAVTNDEDAAAGLALETDAALRLRREAELSASGTATVPAVRRDLLDLRDADGEPLLAACVVEHNPTDYPDAFARPPHSLEAVVQFPAGLAGDALDAARLAVAAQLFASAPGGVTFYGAQSATVLDADARPWVIKWTEPTDVDVYVDLLVTINPETYAGDLAVQEAVVAYGDALVMGRDVLRNRVLKAALDATGVEDVATCAIGVSSTLLATLNLRITPRQRAAFDTSRVAVATVVAVDL